MTTGSHTIDKSVQKTNEIFTLIEADLGWQNHRDQTCNAFRVVLHALRDRLPMIESVKFAAQLPILAKGIYFDSWDPCKNPIKMNQEDFLNHITSEFPLEVEGGASRLVRVVLNAVFDHMDPHEAKKIKNVLPQDIRELFE